MQNLRFMHGEQTLMLLKASGDLFLSAADGKFELARSRDGKQWRDDGSCGPDFMAPDGSGPAKCPTAVQWRTQRHANSVCYVAQNGQAGAPVRQPCPDLSNKPACDRITKSCVAACSGSLANDWSKCVDYRSMSETGWREVQGASGPTAGLRADQPWFPHGHADHGKCGVQHIMQHTLEPATCDPEATNSCCNGSR